MNRKDKENYYLDIAETVLERGTCIRKNYGAIIVNNDEIISTGYAGAPRGQKNCDDLGYCNKERHDMQAVHCRSVHAEANAIISASRNEMMGSTLYLVGRDLKENDYAKEANACMMCKRMMINAGIETVIIRDSKEDYRVIEVCDWVYYDDSLEHRNGH